ncbi:MAG: mandelate racemase/muconate lactonizing enzyme family protein [Acidobacteriota bacterium]
MLSRRSLLQTALFGSGTLLSRANAALKKMKITKVTYWESPVNRPIFNQNMDVVMIETDAGLTGIGEGGSKQMIEQCAGLLIGQDPSRIQHLWQWMYRNFFYPPGREKLHAIGALDLALWDLKGKALDVPVYELLGGLTREYVECYATGFPFKGSTRDAGAACIKAGFRAYRTGVTGQGDNADFRSRVEVHRTFEHCKELAEGVASAGGEWAIDYHTRLDYPDAVRLSTLLEPLEPMFCEDLVRSENPEVYRQLRNNVKVPIAVGEQYGDKWDMNMLVENHLIDYNRITLPNSGGITELMKQAALCETHYVGLVPHFTGPIAESALVHVCGSFGGPALMEMSNLFNPGLPHLPKHYDFREGKMWPVNRPGLGVEVDMSKMKLITEVTQFNKPIPIYRRPDGSITNW